MPRKLGATLIGRAIPDSSLVTPRLRFDKVALGLVRDIRGALEGTVPDGRCVVFTMTAPIREPSKTRAALIEIIREKLSLGAVLAEHAETLHGNDIRVRVVASTSLHAARVAGFVHHPDTPPKLLLDMAQFLLEFVEPPDGAGRDDAVPNRGTLQRVCGQILDAEGCAKFLAAVNQRRE